MIAMRKVLEWGNHQLWSFDGDAYGQMMTQTPVASDAPQAVWLIQPEGMINLPLSKKVAFCNFVVDEVCAWAKLMGLKEARIESPRWREWSRILNGFVVSGYSNGLPMLRKVL